MYNSHELAERIGFLSRSRQNVILVGPANSGKTWFVKNDLIPHLKQQGLTPVYYKNSGDVPKVDPAAVDVVIVDEVEILQDLNYLQALHPNKAPYYSEVYLAKVTHWHKMLAVITLPGIFIVSREKQAISHFINNIHSLDWNSKPAEVIEFTRKP